MDYREHDTKPHDGHPVSLHVMADLAQLLLTVRHAGTIVALHYSQTSYTRGRPPYRMCLEIVTDSLSRVHPFQKTLALLRLLEDITNNRLGLGEDIRICTLMSKIKCCKSSDRVNPNEPRLEFFDSCSVCPVRYTTLLLRLAKTACLTRQRTVP